MDAHSLRPNIHRKLTEWNRDAAVTFAHLRDIGDTLRTYQISGGADVLLRPRRTASSSVAYTRVSNSPHATVELQGW